MKFGTNFQNSSWAPQNERSRVIISGDFKQFFTFVFVKENLNRSRLYHMVKIIDGIHREGTLLQIGRDPAISNSFNAWSFFAVRLIGEREIRQCRQITLLE